MSDSLSDRRPGLGTRALVVLGATATGKTRLAVSLAARFGGEVISVDSRQVYRGLDLGSGKDLQEYGEVPYHLIDVAEPTTEFSLFDYLSGVKTTLQQMHDRQVLPVFAGGTGLFLDALLRGYELAEAPENPALRETLSGFTQDELVARLRELKPLHNTTDVLDRERTIRAIEIATAEQGSNVSTVSISLRPLIIGLRCEPEVMRVRIVRRLEQRLDAGMLDEVRQLHQQGVSWEQLYHFGLEYRYLAAYLRQELNENDMKQKLASAIYQFARQQNKWFRRMERRGLSIHWFEAENPDLEAIDALVRPFAGGKNDDDSAQTQID